MNPEALPEESGLKDLPNDRDNTPENDQPDRPTRVSEEEEHRRPRKKHRPDPEDGENVERRDEEREEKGVSPPEQEKPDEDLEKGDKKQNEVDPEIPIKDRRYTAAKTNRPIGDRTQQNLSDPRVDPLTVEQKIEGRDEENEEKEKRIRHPRQKPHHERGDPRADRGREVQKELSKDGGGIDRKPRKGVTFKDRPEKRKLFLDFREIINHLLYNIPDFIRVFRKKPQKISDLPHRSADRKDGKKYDRNERKEQDRDRRNAARRRARRSRGQLPSRREACLETR